MLHQQLRLRPGIPYRKTRSLPLPLQSHSSQTLVPPSLSISSDEALQRAVAYYEEVWSNGRITMLDKLMTEEHEQMDMVWQPQRTTSGGRRGMKRGILAYRAAYPDIKFHVLDAAVSIATPSSLSTQPFSQAQHPSSSPSSSSVQPPSSSSQGSGHSAHSEPDAPAWAVFVHWCAQGTNLGPIRDQPPTGKAISFTGTSKLVFDGHGRIMRSYVYRQAPADEAAYFVGQGITPWSQATP